ncbi:putative quinol oxidase subunit II transmembrane protein QxtB [Methylocaldum marinum]|uniref:Putative quinol oxidase subunit II transmembrane protein QxtB n=1 Tax=Methylocaldum marinum TaxID=1432792 RepID=A0A250KNJ8_9GAMM|nr:cytochrome d ubiquinol oxidase subunit II [Methylocaldum marinum]BBA33168.1 putative quinol oxidase subunit II transmembrane protein QxtB [Methylocaldum marinum]
MFDLATIWFVLIGVALLAYAILDGFDLGVGILFPLGRNEEERDRMMNSVAPVWDGNETWLILGGGGLFAAFPLAYSLVLTALYAPVIGMLLALILRGVAFEFRFRTQRAKKYWDWAFIGGSTATAFFQGVMVGALVQGIRIEERVYAGGWFDWLSPFSVLCGVALVTGYALLGASWLVIKLDGDLQERMRELQESLGLGTILAIVLISFGTMFVNETIRDRWFGREAIMPLWLIPFATALLALAFNRAIRARRTVTPFLLALGLFATAFMGLAGSLFPYLVPPGITYREAANPDNSLAFMLVGAVILLPLILGYTAYAYWIFRGKVQAGEGYH